MPPKLQLYLSPGACSLASHIALQESRLPFTTTNLSVKAGFPQSHLHLNAKGRVPILDLDGELITENVAIINTISTLAPEKQLLGTTPLEVTRAQEWMAYLSGTLHGIGFGMLFRPKRFVDDEGLYDVIKGKGRETITGCFEYMEKRLEGRKWAVGEQFTVVDGYLLVFYRWGSASGFEVQEKYPNYSRIVGEVAKREGVRRALEAEGIGASGN